MPLRFLIAPDKFKGSLSASKAAQAIESGLRPKFPGAIFDLCPIADGGEGFMETLAPALDARWIDCPAVDALGNPIESRYLIAPTPHGTTAVIEMAETAGMWRIAPEHRNILRTTTRGVGMQISHAIQQNHPSRIVLGLGGSATNDGGTGMAAALGFAFHSQNGQLTDPRAGDLPLITQVDPPNGMKLPEIVAACDVDNPLLGPHGATAVFSPQKGATPTDQRLLESGLTHLVSICRAQAAALTPGAGAAGGLGFGLLHFTAARLVPGFDLLADLLHWTDRIRTADHIITGEGSCDLQSLSGKAPVALARLATAAGKPVTVICGHADAAVRDSGIFHQILALDTLDLPLETLIARAAPLLAELAGSLHHPPLDGAPT